MKKSEIKNVMHYLDYRIDVIKKEIEKINDVCTIQELKEVMKECDLMMKIAKPR